MTTKARVNPVAPVATIAVCLGLLAGLPAAASGPGACVVYSPLGFCLEWETGSPGTPGQPGGGGSTAPQPVTCYWVTSPRDLSTDPTIYVDYNISRPPEGVDVVWQVRHCSDGTILDEIRWIIPVTPEGLASNARGRLAGILPAPSVSTSPPIGTAAILGVPVFVEVTNWSGMVTESECGGGMCVTVTAAPALTFAPGAPGTDAFACADRGTTFVPGAGTPASQASAPGACAHAYAHRTGVEGRPEFWQGEVTVRWTITWTASTGASGSLPAVVRSTSVPRAVEEVQTVVVGGGVP